MPGPGLLASAYERRLRCELLINFNVARLKDSLKRLVHHLPE
jgi:hypothetical protein